MKMNAGYWKLWHDTRGRFYISAIILGCLMYLTLLPSIGRPRPTPCYRAFPGEPSWATTRAAAVQTRPLYREAALTAAQIADGDVLAAHCRTAERPNTHYAYMVQLFSRDYVDGVWGAALPYLMLFIGIMLSVGPPFSGESMEAFSLTFSLPWTRERWLVSKMFMATALCMVLIATMLVISAVITHFPDAGQMRARVPQTPAVFRPTVVHVLATALSAFVGVSLGTAASMYTRNMLSATVLAGIVAYLLVSFNVVELGTQENYLPTHTAAASRLVISYGTEPLMLIVVIGMASLLAMTRLRNIDY